MAHNFNEKSLEESIQKKDLWGLRATVVMLIEFDPTFSSGEYEYVISRLKKEVPEVFVEYRLLSKEENFREDESSWDKNYFLDLTFYLQENFCLDRIDNIKRVGEKVYGREKVNSAQEAESKQKKTETREIEAKKIEAKKIETKAVEAEKSFSQPSKPEKIRTAKSNKKNDAPALGKMILALVVIVGVLIAVFQNFQN